MLGRLRTGATRSTPSLLQRLRMILNRPPGVRSHEWNIRIPPDLMCHIIDTYLTPSTKMALCIAFPVVQPYCHRHPYRHILVYIRDAWLPSHKFFLEIQLSSSRLKQLNAISISTLDDLGCAVGERPSAVISLAADLTRDVTSIEFDVTIKWCQLDKDVKVYIMALLRHSNLCFVSLSNFDIPVNILGVARNLKILQLDSKIGRPDNDFLSTKKGKIYLEEVDFCSGLLPWLIGSRSPFDWSRMRAIKFHRYWGGSEELFKLCPTSLERLEFLVGDGGEGSIDLSVLTSLRHIKISISLSDYVEQTMYDNPGTFSSLTPFEWVPYILATCNGYNTVEKIVLEFRTVDYKDLGRCDWLSVDKIFEGKGTWTSLEEVLVVDRGSGGFYRPCGSLPEDPEWMEHIATPCLQERQVIIWRRDNE